METKQITSTELINAAKIVRAPPDLLEDVRRRRASVERIDELEAKP